MPYRDRYDLWFNIPGVVAAYQPVMAPDPLLACINVRSEQRTPATYAAVPGVAPVWASRTGWTFAGSQYLSTQYALGAPPFTMICRWANATATVNRTAMGSHPSESLYALLAHRFNSLTQTVFGGHQNSVGSQYSAVVLGMTTKHNYVNGKLYSGLSQSWSGTSAVPVYIGAERKAADPAAYFAGNILVAAIYARDLSPAEMRHMSRQMAYCDVNPDWSAWGRRRRYYYGPQVAAGFQAAWAAQSNAQIGTGVN